MLEKDAALKRYDDLVQRGRRALAFVLSDTTQEKIIWFEQEKFIADLEHFLNEALEPDSSYLFGEDINAGCKREFKF